MTKPPRPFFSYYGSKWSRVRDGFYPQPEHDLIIEPFAGSACYALHHHERDVVLVEKNPVIASIWSYLISVDPDEVLALPLDPLEIEPGPAKDLVGFWLGRGRASPARTKSAWMRSENWNRSFWGEGPRARISEQVGYIRHWSVVEASYEQTPSVEATWFVDPPYQGRAGQHYRRFGSAHIDYAALGRWCRERRGLTIVCEGAGADWLPFNRAGKVKSIRQRWSDEALWVSRGPHERVRTVLRQRGVARRPRERKRWTKEMVRRLVAAIDSGLALRQLEERFGVSEGRLRQVLTRWGR